MAGCRSALSGAPAARGRVDCEGDSGGLGPARWQQSQRDLLGSQAAPPGKGRRSYALAALRAALLLLGRRPRSSGRVLTQDPGTRATAAQGLQRLGCHGSAVGQAHAGASLSSRPSWPLGARGLEAGVVSKSKTPAARPDTPPGSSLLNP